MSYHCKVTYIDRCYFVMTHSEVLETHLDKIVYLFFDYIICKLLTLRCANEQILEICKEIKKRDIGRDAAKKLQPISDCCHF